MCRAYIKQAVILIVYSVIYDLRAVRRFRGWRTCFRSVSDWPRQSRWRKVRHVLGVMAREELRSFSRFMNLTLTPRDSSVGDVKDDPFIALRKCTSPGSCVRRALLYPVLLHRRSRCYSFSSRNWKWRVLLVCSRYGVMAGVTRDTKINNTANK